MNYFYVEECQDIPWMIEQIVVNSKSMYDRSTRAYYIRVGAGFDTETSKVPLNKDIFGIDSTAFCYHWQLGLGNMAILGRSLETMTETLLWLIETIKEKKPKHKLMIFDANLGYEWQFCRYYWSRLHITKVFAKEKRKPLRIELDNVLEFVEVIGLFGKSLADIAKKYTNVRKLTGDLNHDLLRNSYTKLTDEEIGYCVRDVEILVDMAYNHVFKNYMGKNGKVPLTKTSIVRTAVKREAGHKLKGLKEEFHDLMPTEDEYELFRVYLFKGGISGSNIMKMNRVYSNRIKGADITSDYPYQMLSKQFPVGEAILCDSEEFMEEKIPYIAYIKFIKFRSRNEHALMSSHKALNVRQMIRDEDTVLDNNRIQYANSVELILNDVEYTALKKAYKWKRAFVIKCWKFPKGYSILPQYVRKTAIDWYLKKERLKADKERLENEAPESDEYKEIAKEYAWAKEFVNSLFGMMCTALYLEDYQFLEEICAIDIPKGEDGKPIFKSYDEAIQNLFLSPYWGFWITSYARSMLIDVITRFPKCIIQYDTDSVYYDTAEKESTLLEVYLEKQNAIMRAMNDIRFCNNERMQSLGTWDFTQVFKRFKALGAKRYMYEKQNGKIEVVIAGHRKDKNGRPTLLNQCDYDNETNGTNIDYFDFFTDRLVIDKEHSNKLCSHYIDVPIRVNFTDYQNNEQEIFSPAAIVLEPIEFNMKMGKKHKDLLVAVERFMRNATNERRMVYDIWRKLKESN